MTATELWGHIGGFEAHNRSRRLSPRTLAIYDLALRSFREWCAEQHSPDAEITAQIIREYISHRLDKGYAGTTVRSDVATIRAMFNWLVADEVIEASMNPMRLVKNPRIRLPDIHPLTADQVREFLDAFDQASVTDYRNYTLSVLLLDTGLRAGEVVALRLGDVDLDKSRIKVNHAKGNKTRTVFLGETTTKLLRHYIDYCRPWLRKDGSDVLFPLRQKSDGRGNKQAQMTVKYLSTKIRNKFDQVGIERCNSSTHRLRHTFATNFIRAEGNLLVLQKLLGHADLEMTKRYVTLIDEDLQQAHRMASPVDRFNLPAPAPPGRTA